MLRCRRLTTLRYMQYMYLLSNSFVLILCLHLQDDLFLWLHGICERVVGAKKIKKDTIRSIAKVFDEDPRFQYMTVDEICTQIADINLNVVDFLVNKQIAHKLSIAISNDIYERNQGKTMDQEGRAIAKVEQDQAHRAETDAAYERERQAKEKQDRHAEAINSRSTQLINPVSIIFYCNYSYNICLMHLC